MVFGAINYRGEEYFTLLSKIFGAIQNIQEDYNWLITNYEGYPNNSEIDKMFCGDYCWISGSELTKIVRDEDFQWVWAVLSGFDKQTELSTVLKYELPYADGNTGFWRKPFRLQHPLAKIEIVAWDSTLTLMYTKEKKIFDNFLGALPYSENLEKYIEKWTHIDL